MERINITVTSLHVRQANQSNAADDRVCNPVSIAARQAFNAQSAFCTEQSISFRFSGDVTYTQVFKLPAIAQDYLGNPHVNVKVPFSFALGDEHRLW